jgi:hypothetical protein
MRSTPTPTRVQQPIGRKLDQITNQAREDKRPKPTRSDQTAGQRKSAKRETETHLRPQDGVSSALPATQPPAAARPVGTQYRTRGPLRGKLDDISAEEAKARYKAKQKIEKQKIEDEKKATKKATKKAAKEKKSEGKALRVSKREKGDEEKGDEGRVEKKRAKFVQLSKPQTEKINARKSSQ